MEAKKQIKKKQLKLFPSKPCEIVAFNYVDLSSNRKINLKANTIINFWLKNSWYMIYRKLDGYDLKKSESIDLRYLRYIQKNNPLRNRERQW